MYGKPRPCLTLCALLLGAESGSDQGWPTLLTRDLGPHPSSRIHFMSVSPRYDDDDDDNDDNNDNHDSDDNNSHDRHPNQTISPSTFHFII